MIVDQWDISFGSVECFCYDHGIKFAHSDGTAYQGQAAATFDGKDKGGLCALTWKDGGIVDGAVCREFACQTPTKAELYAMYVLMRRGIDRGFTDDFLAQTNSLDVAETLNEKLLINNDTEERTLRIHLRRLKRFYKNFHCSCEPNEKMAFVDSLLKPMSQHMVHVTTKNWSHLLKGKPLFKLHQNEDKLQRDFINKAPAGGNIYIQNSYKVELPDSETKSEAVRNVVLSLAPPSVTIAVKDFSTAMELKTVLESVTENEYSIQLHKTNMAVSLVLTGSRKSTQKNKGLVIICDVDLLSCYRQNAHDLCIVLISPTDECRTSLKELSAECYLYFNGSEQYSLIS